MKKTLAILLIALFAVPGVFAGGKSESAGPAKSAASEAKPLVLRYGEMNPESHIMAKVGMEFIKLVEQKSNGQIKIEFYPGQQLGDEKTQMQAVQMGAIDLFRANCPFLVDYGAKKLSVYSLPYMFRDRDHLWKVLESDIGKDMLESIQKSGTKMVGLASYDEGARNFFFTKKFGKPESLDRLRNAKIRVQQNQMMMDMVASIGASPTPIAWAETYTALQTGVVDGAENPPTGYLSNSLEEVAPYYMLDGHTYAPCIIVMSELTWNKLTDAQRAIMKEAAADVQKVSKAMAEKDDAEAFRIMKQKGITIIDVPDKKPWQEKVRPMYAKYGAEYLDLIKKIQDK